MRSFRKIALVAGVVILALALILAAIPLVFGDRITARLKAQIDESIEARVARRRAQLAPRLSQRLDDGERLVRGRRAQTWAISTAWR